MPQDDELHPPLNPRQIIDTFAKYGVDFIIVGGSAANLHGATRETRDFDAVVARAIDNVGKLATALNELDGRIRTTNMSDYDARQLSRDKKRLIVSNNITRWRTSAGDIDLLTFIPGQYGDPCYYADLEHNADRQTVGNMQIWVAGLDDIIASKRYADRPKDREALPELYRLQSQVTKRPEKKRIRASRSPTPNVSYKLDNSPGLDL